MTCCALAYIRESNYACCCLLCTCSQHVACPQEIVTRMQAASRENMPTGSADKRPINGRKDIHIFWSAISTARTLHHTRTHIHRPIDASRLVSSPLRPTGLWCSFRHLLLATGLKQTHTHTHGVCAWVAVCLSVCLRVACVRVVRFSPVPAGPCESRKLKFSNLRKQSGTATARHTDRRTQMHTTLQLSNLSLPRGKVTSTKSSPWPVPRCASSSTDSTPIFISPRR